MEEENFPLPQTKKCWHEKQMGDSVWTIEANIPGFMPTKLSHFIFLFDNKNVHSEKTVNKDNKAEVRNKFDNNNKIQWEWILWNHNMKNSKNYLDNAIALNMLYFVGIYFKW